MQQSKRLTPKVLRQTFINVRFIIEFIFFLMFLLSCNNGDRIRYENEKRNGEYIITKKTYDKYKHLVEEVQLDKDSVRNGSYIKYDMGKIKCLGHYRNNIKDSSWVYLDYIGDTVKRENWFGGKLFGEQLQFYSKPQTAIKSPLYKYIFNDLEGKRLFDMSFDIYSKMINFEGVPLYIAYNSENLRAKDNFELICFFGIPPSFFYEMKIKEWNANDKKKISYILVTDTTASLQTLFLGKRFFWTKKYNKKGIYILEVVFLIKDRLDNILIHDTSNLRIKIK